MSRRVMIVTGGSRGIVADAARLARAAGGAKRVPRQATRVPPRRTAAPGEAASPAIWLLSDVAGHATGSRLEPSGGV
jgi:NAD(P)-dependent dehydrogenase (short-subunit alcohol dehydrogenase family)